MTIPNSPITYRDAGVDIDRGNDLVRRIKPLAHATRRAGVLSGVGGFGALFEVPTDRYTHPVLVSGADGVGTKLRLALELGIHDTVGIDLVAMCVNDILVLGAEPLFFLDYFATAKIDPDIAEKVIAGIAQGCQLAGAALVGGECAEMPGMYQGDDYDLAGFCVGVVEKDAIIDPAKVTAGDVLIGLASSGVHSNGFSLVRKILESTNASLDTLVGGRPLGEQLLAPTRIYVNAVLDLLKRRTPHAIAHITGGGLLENIARVLPSDVTARISTSRRDEPALFDWIRRAARLPDEEMHRTFNCGIGLVICVSETDLEDSLGILQAAGERPYHIGTVEPASRAPVIIEP